PGVALKTDPNLVNPWGLAFSPKGPFWVADNHTSLATVYNTGGQIQPLVVTIPGAGGGALRARPHGTPTGTGAPTGEVFNGVTADFNGDIFIFVGEDGVISGWKTGTSADIEVDNSAAGAVYKGAAIAKNSMGRFLFVTN